MKLKQFDGSIVAIDLDGTLCSGECFTKEECIKAKPIQEIINVINTKLYRDGGCFIIINTARRENLRNATEFWLKKYGVRYHILNCGKLWAQYYIDDRNILIKDLLGDD